MAGTHGDVPFPASEPLRRMPWLPLQLQNGINNGMLQKGFSVFQRFLGVIETELEIEDAPESEPLEDLKGSVTYDNVSFHSGKENKTEILSHISFQEQVGHSIALVRTIQIWKNHHLQSPSSLL